MVQSILSMVLPIVLSTQPIAGTVSKIEVLNAEPISLSISVDAGTPAPNIEKTPLSSRQIVLRDTCMEFGYDEDACWKNLEAMIIKESQGKARAVGDGGRSHGFYQIQLRMHGVSKVCSQDLQCSSRWTLANLERNGYKENPFYAIKRHNGDGPMATRYANHVLKMASAIGE
ncbi:MAG: hypothetical protein G01um101418_167 [Parcubacteria group bacterium Gr01-1014_18]|nr:MAG: hypothetical protein Greene041636_135 [Parcubacteria group bacterium Greene0416_36]TSC81327.1 MAG: hypothetical protein G01um101418_167 [Parcubacteria group bacterium Gr01-1014_18]TSC99487.1 MAG: hypothetical protein Greene101420_154 [Parcubacteria group bacterium Greene1014_20]TSD07594.1 MAG: hypothetical protein Greene07142_51 [Parcubacteria group bacterium Greene0714_2]